MEIPRKKADIRTLLRELSPSCCDDAVIQAFHEFFRRGSKEECWQFVPSSYRQDQLVSAGAGVSPAPSPSANPVQGSLHQSTPDTTALNAALPSLGTPRETPQQATVDAEPESTTSRDAASPIIENPKDPAQQATPDAEPTSTTSGNAASRPLENSRHPSRPARTSDTVVKSKDARDRGKRVRASFRKANEQNWDAPETFDACKSMNPLGSAVEVVRHLDSKSASNIQQRFSYAFFPYAVYRCKKALGLGLSEVFNKIMETGTFEKRLDLNLLYRRASRFQEWMDHGGPGTLITLRCSLSDVERVTEDEILSFCQHRSEHYPQLDQASRSLDVSVAAQLCLGLLAQGVQHDQIIKRAVPLTRMICEFIDIGKLIRGEYDSYLDRNDTIAGRALIMPPARNSNNEGNTTSSGGSKSHATLRPQTMIQASSTSSTDDTQTENIAPKNLRPPKRRKLTAHNKHRLGLGSRLSTVQAAQDPPTLEHVSLNSPIPAPGHCLPSNVTIEEEECHALDPMGDTARHETESSMERQNPRACQEGPRFNSRASTDNEFELLSLNTASGMHDPMGYTRASDITEYLTAEQLRDLNPDIAQQHMPFAI